MTSSSGDPFFARAGMTAGASKQFGRRAQEHEMRKEREAAEKAERQKQEKKQKAMQKEQELVEKGVKAIEKAEKQKRDEAKKAEWMKRRVRLHLSIMSTAVNSPTVD